MTNDAAPVQWLKADATRIPFEVHTRQDIYDQEQETIFRGPTWNYLALEAEIPNRHDFKTSFLGDTPVVVSRAGDGRLHAFVNRCAHRGATVQRQPSGNTKEHRCVYHQWCYDSAGGLIGVPYRRGIQGVGGYPADFNMRDHGLRTLKVASHKGVIFGTLDGAPPPLEDYLDAPLVDAIDRLFSRPIKVLGHMRQRIRGNWKLYAENTRDPYHAALLHMFHATFGTYRSNQKSVGYIDRTGAHATGAKYGDEFGHASSTSDAVGQDNVLNYSLADPSLMRGRPDFNDGVTVSITSIFPSLVVQQIMNTLATRHIRPKAPNEFELYWTYFGYADDDDEMLRARIKQANLVGPAGLISMEDGEAIELIQRAIQRGDDSALLEFGGRGPLKERGNGEGAIRGFWMHYARMMGFAASDGIASG